MNATLRHEDVSFLSMVVEVQSFHIVPSHRARAELMTPPCPPLYAKIGNNEAIQTSRRKNATGALHLPLELTSLPNLFQKTSLNLRMPRNKWNVA